MFANQKSFAQQPTSGITVAPAIIQMSLSQAEPTAAESIGIRNNYSVPIGLKIELVGVDDSTGQVVPADTKKSDLSPFTTISPSQLTLPPGKSINVKLTLNNATSLGPGGHYGALLIKPVSLGSKQIGVQQAISVRLFVVKEDGAVRTVVLRNMTLQQSVFRLPKVADLTFQATGNVQVVPRGTIEILDSNKTLAKGIINTESVPILPGKMLTTKTNLSQLARSNFPGRYKITVAYHAERSASMSSETIYFWYIPPWTIFALIFLIICYMLQLRYARLQKPLSSQQNRTKNTAPLVGSLATKNSGTIVHKPKKVANNSQNNKASAKKKLPTPDNKA